MTSLPEPKDMLLLSVISVFCDILMTQYHNTWDSKSVERETTSNLGFPF